MIAKLSAGIAALVCSLACSLVLTQPGNAAPPGPKAELRVAEATRKIQPDAATLELMERARRGNARAQNRLGELYENGEGVEQSFEEAAKWYRKAAEQRRADAEERFKARRMERTSPVKVETGA